MYTLINWISHCVSVPNSCVETPMRPYTAARGAASSSRAMRSIVARGDAAARGDRVDVERSQRRQRDVEILDLAGISFQARAAAAAQAP